MTYNRLLDALSQELYEKLSLHLITIDLEQGAVLRMPGETIQNLYFPINCLLSITITMADGSTAETGVIGNREVLGVNAFMGGGYESTQTEYVVQIGGRAVKMSAIAFQEEFERNSELRFIFLKYTQAFIAQLSQTTACNRLHSLEQRLGRWLLESHDRVESDDIHLTQQFISEMLGYRRAGVTLAAQKLQDDGLISYGRGCIHIRDLQGLEFAACECYSVVRSEYDRLLGCKHDKKHNRSSNSP